MAFILYADKETPYDNNIFAPYLLIDFALLSLAVVPGVFCSAAEPENNQKCHKINRI